MTTVDVMEIQGFLKEIDEKLSLLGVYL